MREVRPTTKLRKGFQGCLGGFTFIEVLIALALFSIIAIVFAGGLSTASRAVRTADVRTRAESLARTQMESIKDERYNSTYTKISIAGVTFPSGPYDICSWNGSAVVNCTYTDRIMAVAWNSSSNRPANGETGLQKVTLVIRHEGREVTRLEGYKVDR